MAGLCAKGRGGGRGLGGPGTRVRLVPPELTLHVLPEAQAPLPWECFSLRPP